MWNFTSVRVTDATTNPETTTPLILTGATIRMTAKTNIDDSDADAVFQATTASEITITNDVLGEYTVKLPPSLTSGLDMGDDGQLELFFDVQIDLGATNGQYVSGDVVTVSSGILSIGIDRTLTTG